MHIQSTRYPFAHNQVSTMSELQKKNFEAEASKRGLDLSVDSDSTNDSFLNSETQTAWTYWQLAQSSSSSAPPMPSNAGGMTEIKALIGNLEPDWLEQVMEKVQEYASAYSTVGGPFDQGQAMEDADTCKRELECMLEGLSSYIDRLSKDLLSVHAVGEVIPMSLIQALADERVRQDGKWGGQGNDDAKPTSHFVWLIEKYASWADVMASMGSVEKCRRRLTQVAAMAIASIQSIDRGHGVTPGMASQGNARQ